MAADERLRKLLDVARLFAVETELSPLLDDFTRATCGLLGCERASVFVHDAATNELVSRSAIGAGEIRVPVTSGIAGAAFATREVLHVPSAYDDTRFYRAIDEKTGYVTRDLLAVSMIDVCGKPVGVLQAINSTGRPFDDEDELLIRLLADQAAVALQRHELQQSAVRTAALRYEMKLARQIQDATIPRVAPTVAGLDCAGWKKPASETSGDCFDLWTLPDGRLGVLLMDAAGHGIGPTLIVSQARTLLRGLAEVESDPHELLRRVNRRLIDDMIAGRFVTAFVGFFSSDGGVDWASAGHGLLFFRPDPAEAVQLLEPTAPPLGVMAEWDAACSGRVTLVPGGSVAVVSDGIFEAVNVAGEMLGSERVCDLLDSHRVGPPAAIAAVLARAAETWHGDPEPKDDQTVVIVKRMQQSE